MSGTIQTSKIAAKVLPETPGVYLFETESGERIYIGKAKNLRSRVLSYFAGTLAPKTSQMVKSASNLSFVEVGSEFEALLLEAHLVGKYQPKYNIALKDDKSPLYIGITAEEYPRVIPLRRTQFGLVPLKYKFGPFLASQSVKRVLKLARRTFHYGNHKATNRACIYHQIGLCDPCPSQIANETDTIKKKQLKKLYMKNVTNVRKLLLGKIDLLKKTLEKEMKIYVGEEKFEEAGMVKNQIERLVYLTTPQTEPELYLEDPNLLEDIRDQEGAALKKLLQDFYEIADLQRIECFDVAHLAGTYPAASMVTFVGGEPDKNFYRHFRVKRAKKQSDVDAMREILKRRARYFSDPSTRETRSGPAGWGRPDLIIIDGGKPQVSIAMEVLTEFNIAVIGLAKRYETIVVKKEGRFFEVRVPRGPALNLLQRVRDEAHRFARRLHHRLVERAIRV